MSRRIDIELTSSQADGLWTWRAAGARQPKGLLDGQVLYSGAKAGDVVKAEADFELDGITILSVAAPREKKRSEPERIELLAPSGPAVGGVTTQLTGRSERRPEHRRDRDSGPRTGGPRTGAPREGGSREGGSRDGGSRPGGSRDGSTVADGRGPASGGDRSGRREGGAGQDRGAGQNRRPGPDRSPSRGERPPGGDRSTRRPGPDRAAGRDSPAGGDRSAGSDGTERSSRRDGGDGRPSASADRSRGRRLNPASTHRQAAMEGLPPEQQPIAEQVLRGGIPAVRTAIALEREKAVAEGRQAPNVEQLLSIAEQILPVLKAAEWRDRAEAAAKSPTEISLRDLRSVVAGGDTARDDETRALAAGLREALDSRVTALGTSWTDEIEHHLSENRIVRALRLAGRPPETSTRLPAELSERLSAVASSALAPDTPAERWVALLEAVADSPVRRSVKPVGLPTDATPEVTRIAHQQSGRVPALTSLLGLAIPPPPGPRRPSGGSGGGPRRAPNGPARTSSVSEPVPAGDAGGPPPEPVHTASGTEDAG